MPKARGFTLVELLVVVAIIAILSVIGITLFANVQKNARDAKRRSDIDAMANALESKKEPGLSTYLALSDSDMGSGAIPADPLSKNTNTIDETGPFYCIKLYDTANGASLDTNPAWDTYPDNNCFGLFIANAVPTNGFDTMGSRFPADRRKSWKLCAKLENKTVYCKDSTQ